MPGVRPETADIRGKPRNDPPKHRVNRSEPHSKAGNPQSATRFSAAC